MENYFNKNRINYKGSIGSIEKPLHLKTPPLSSACTVHVEQKDNREILVCTVKSTILHYDLRCLDDLHQLLKVHGDWIDLGSKEEKQEALEGTVEYFGRSTENPIGGWYGLKKGLRGRFGMYIPPILEYLGWAELEHNKRNNRMRAK